MVFVLCVSSNIMIIFFRPSFAKLSALEITTKLILYPLILLKRIEWKTERKKKRKKLCRTHFAIALFITFPTFYLFFSRCVLDLCRPAGIPRKSQIKTCSVIQFLPSFFFSHLVQFAFTIFFPASNARHSSRFLLLN